MTRWDEHGGMFSSFPEQHMTESVFNSSVNEALHAANARCATLCGLRLHSRPTSERVRAGVSRGTCDPGGIVYKQKRERS